MKRISPGTVTVGVLAIVFGLVAAYFVRHLLNEAPVAVKADPGVPIVVARVNIPTHSRVRLEDLRVVMVPREQEVPESVLRRPEIAADRIITTTLTAGQALHADMLLGIGERLPGLADQIPAGMRALAIAIPVADARLIEPGAHVDITMTVEGDHPDLGELATRTLLRQIAVVEVGRNRNTRATDTESTVTVAVLPKDANILINAQRTGTLNMTLCSSQGTAVDESDDSITRRELLGLRDIPPQVPYTVEKWEGSMMRTIELGENRVREAEQATAADTGRSGTFRNTSVPSGGERDHSAIIQPRVVGPPVAAVPAGPATKGE